MQIEPKGENSNLLFIIPHFSFQLIIQVLDDFSNSVSQFKGASAFDFELISAHNQLQ